MIGAFGLSLAVVSIDESKVCPMIAVSLLNLVKRQASDGQRTGKRGKISNSLNFNKNEVLGVKSVFYVKNELLKHGAGILKSKRAKDPEAVRFKKDRGISPVKLSFIFFRRRMF